MARRRALDYLVCFVNPGRQRMCTISLCVLSYIMFEFLFGFVLGVWAGQALPLPSVGAYVKNNWLPQIQPAQASETQDEEDQEDQELQPLFTGEMPLSIPSSGV